MEGGGAAGGAGGSGDAGGGASRSGGSGKVDVNSLVSCKVDNLSFDATKDDLSAMFSPFGM